jgi:hypothetical protein
MNTMNTIDIAELQKLEARQEQEYEAARVSCDCTPELTRLSVAC